MLVGRGLQATETHFAARLHKFFSFKRRVVARSFTKSGEVNCYMFQHIFGCIRMQILAGGGGRTQFHCWKVTDQHLGEPGATLNGGELGKL